MQWPPLRSSVLLAHSPPRTMPTAHGIAMAMSANGQGNTGFSRVKAEWVSWCRSPVKCPEMFSACLGILCVPPWDKSLRKKTLIWRIFVKHARDLIRIAKIGVFSGEPSRRAARTPDGRRGPSPRHVSRLPLPGADGSGAVRVCVNDGSPADSERLIFRLAIIVYCL